MMNRISNALFTCFLLFAGPVLAQNTYKTQPLTNEERSQLIQFVSGYITWPVNYDTFTLCVLGNTSVNSFDYFNHNPIGGKSVEIKPAALSDAGSCHAMYIASSEENNLPDILHQTKKHSVLLFSEIKNFEKRGGSVLLFSANNKPALSLNMEDINNRKLTISNELLKDFYVIPNINADGTATTEP